MNIAAILKKLAAGEKISADEKAILLANKEVLSEAQVKAAEEAEVEADEDVDDEEEVDDEAVKTLISKSIATQLESITSDLANKFAAGVTEARAKAIDTGASEKSKVEEKTRTFMKALFEGDRQALKDISGLSDSAGGYLMPVELSAEVLRISESDYGLARREMRYLPFSGPGNTRKIPSLASSVAVAWTDEAAKKSSTAPTFGIVTQTLKKLAAIVPMTEEILEDSNINLTALVAELFAEAVAKEEDIQFFNGTGSPWTGILNNGSVNVVNMASADGDTIDAEDLLAMIDKTPSGALSGAKFYMNRTVFSKLRALRSGGSTTGDGAYLIQSPVAGEPATIWGYPIVLSDAFPTVTQDGDNKPLVLFGNLKKAAIFGDKQELRVKMLDQATVRNSGNSADLNLAQQDMVAIRIVERVGYVLAIPGAVTVLKTQDS